MNRSTPGLPVHHQLREFTQTPGRPSSQWCHPAISSSVVPFSSCPQSLPASESFPMSQLCAWDGQSTGVLALASFLPKNTQGWSPLEWTGWIPLPISSIKSLLSKPRIFTVVLASKDYHLHLTGEEPETHDSLNQYFSSFIVHANCLGIFLNCRFWFSRSGIRLDSQHF